MSQPVTPARSLWLWRRRRADERVGDAPITRAPSPARSLRHECDHVAAVEDVAALGAEEPRSRCQSWRRALPCRLPSRTDGATRVTPATRTCGSNKAGLDQPTSTVALVATGRSPHAACRALSCRQEPIVDACDTRDPPFSAHARPSPPRQSGHRRGWPGRCSRVDRRRPLPERGRAAPLTALRKPQAGRASPPTSWQR